MGHLQEGVVVLQGVVPVVVAEGAFGPAAMRRDAALNGELGFGDKGQTASNVGPIKWSACLCLLAAALR